MAIDDWLTVALLVVAGGLAVYGAAADARWFWDHRQARLWVRLFGRTGARVFYGLLGALLLAVAAGLVLTSG